MSKPFDFGQKLRQLFSEGTETPEATRALAAKLESRVLSFLTSSSVDEVETQVPRALGFVRERLGRVCEPGLVLETLIFPILGRNCSGVGRSQARFLKLVYVELKDEIKAAEGLLGQIKLRLQELVRNVLLVAEEATISKDTELVIEEAEVDVCRGGVALLSRQARRVAAGGTSGGPRRVLAGGAERVGGAGSLSEAAGLLGQCLAAGDYSALYQARLDRGELGFLRGETEEAGSERPGALGFRLPVSLAPRGSAPFGRRGGDSHSRSVKVSLDSNSPKEPRDSAESRGAGRDYLGLGRGVRAPLKLLLHDSRHLHAARPDSASNKSTQRKNNFYYNSVEKRSRQLQSQSQLIVDAVSRGGGRSVAIRSGDLQVPEALGGGRVLERGASIRGGDPQTFDASAGIPERRLPGSVDLLLALEKLIPAELDLLRAQLARKFWAEWTDRDFSALTRLLFRGPEAPTAWTRVSRSAIFMLETHRAAAVCRTLSRVVGLQGFFEHLSGVLFELKSRLFAPPKIDAARAAFFELMSLAARQLRAHSAYFSTLYAQDEGVVEFLRGLLAEEPLPPSSRHCLQPALAFFTTLLEIRRFDAGLRAAAASALDPPGDFSLPRLPLASLVAKISDEEDFGLLLSVLDFAKKALAQAGRPALRASYLRAAFLETLRLYPTQNLSPQKTLVFQKLLKLLRALVQDSASEEATHAIKILRVLEFFGQELQIRQPPASPPASSSAREFKLDFSKLALPAKAKQFVNPGETPLPQRRLLSPQFENKKTHFLFVEVLLALLLNESNNSFHEELTGQYPSLNGKRNFLFILQTHLNLPENREFLFQFWSRLDLKAARFEFQTWFSSHRKSRPICGDFAEKAAKVAFEGLTGRGNPDPEPESPLPAPNIARAFRRVLKIMNESLEKKYRVGNRIGTGAFSTVHEAKYKDSSAFAIKLVEGDRSEHERNPLFLLFSEVSVLENLARSARKVGARQAILELLDYGGTLDGGYFLLFPKLEKREETQGSLPKTLKVFHNITAQLAELHKQGVTHYDVKCDNIMQGGYGSVLIDFGESLQHEQNLRLRGTEFIRAPELLLSGFEAFAFDAPNFTLSYKEAVGLYNRQNKCAVGPCCDVWGLGCLLFELYTGKFLFMEKDWALFFERVTNDTVPVLSDQALDAIERNVFIINLLDFTLNRNPEHRPTAQGLLKRVNAVCRILGIDPEISNFKPTDCYRQLATTRDQHHSDQARTHFASFSLPASNERLISKSEPLLFRVESDVCDFEFAVNEFILVRWGARAHGRKDVDVMLLEPERFGIKCQLLGSVLSEQELTQIAEKLSGIFWHILRELKTAKNKGHQLMLQSKDGLIPVVMGLLLHTFEIDDFSLASLIVYENRTFGVVEFSESLFLLASLAFEKIRDLEDGFKSLRFIFCDCTECFVHFEGDERVENRSCRCSKVERTAQNWECSFGCCSEYLDYIAKRNFDVRKDQITWGSIPQSKLQNSGFIESSKQEDWFEALKSVNNLRLQKILVKDERNSLVFCESCEVVIFGIDAVEDTASFIAEKAQNYQRKLLI